MVGGCKVVRFVVSAPSKISMLQPQIVHVSLYLVAHIKCHHGQVMIADKVILEFSMH
jgi:hypothetical protein